MVGFCVITAVRDLGVRPGVNRACITAYVCGSRDVSAFQLPPARPFRLIIGLLFPCVLAGAFNTRFPGVPQTAAA